MRFGLPLRSPQQPLRMVKVSKWLPEDLRFEARLLQLSLRREQVKAYRQRQRVAQRARRMEDTAFVLFCKQDWNDECFRLCLEKIVSSSPDLDADT